jgi:lactoylglutathione lyase
MELELGRTLQNVGAITLFVEDAKRSKSFYERVFEVPLVFKDEASVAFKFENTIVNLLQSTAAKELIDPGTVAGPDAGSRFQLTIWVTDIDAVCTRLAALGVELLNGPMNREWGMRTASFTDPDGHIWEIAQEVGQPAS